MGKHLIPGKSGVFERPGDIQSIPRDGKPIMMEEAEYQWARKPSDNIPGISDEKVRLENIGNLNSIPRDRSTSEQTIPNDLDWRREPNGCIPGIIDDSHIFDSLDNLDLTPKTRQPGDTETEDDLDWARSLFCPPSQDNHDAPFIKPDVTDSSPYSRQPDEVAAVELLTEWVRSPNIPGVPPEDDDLYDRPYDLRSIPRDGNLREGTNPEVSWARNPDKKVLGVDEEDPLLDQIGKLNSVPRDTQPDYTSPTGEVGWGRTPGTNIPGVHDEHDALTTWPSGMLAASSGTTSPSRWHVVVTPSA